MSCMNISHHHQNFKQSHSPPSNHLNTNNHNSFFTELKINTFSSIILQHSTELKLRYIFFVVIINIIGGSGWCSSSSDIYDLINQSKSQWGPLIEV